MRESVRILAFYLMSYCGAVFSGVERRFIELSSNLTSLGARIFTLEYKPSLLESWDCTGYYSIGLSRSFMTHDILEAIRLILYGLSACLKCRCDVIYVPGGFPHGSLRVLLPPFVVSVLCRRPFVVVTHHLKSRRGCDFRSVASRAVRLLIHNRVKTCIAVSRATAADVRKNYRLAQVVVTGNGVNQNLFRSMKDQAKLHDAAFFGRLSEEKGISTLLEAWRIVVRNLPSAKLLLLGGTEEYTSDSHRRTQKMVEKLGLSENITLVGYVSDQQAVNLLNSSRVFVLPSNQEGFGLTTLEAMAIGLPCVLSGLPALRENFHSAALFAEPKDARGFAQAILELLSDPERCREFGERGRMLARKYSWSKVARKELRVLSSLRPD